MRNETKELQKRVSDLQSSDERVAGQINALQSWSERLDRFIEEERAKQKAYAESFANALQTELRELRAELKSIAEKLTGDTPQQEKPTEGEAAQQPGGDVVIPGSTVSPLHRKKA